MASLNIQLLLTGDELMLGDIVDSNSAMIAQQLNELGLVISRKVTVSDDPVLLTSEIQYMTQQADILIINGGLGPTLDDLTSEVLAKVSHSPLTENAAARAHLENWAKQKNITLNKANLKQALLPKSASIIPNRIGSAVGIQLNVNQCEVYCTPGVPRELKVMMDDEIIPNISDTFKSSILQQNNYHISRLHTFGIGESFLEDLIFKAVPNWSEEINLGFRASAPLVEIKLTSQNNAITALKAQYLEAIKNQLNDHVLDYINQKPKPLSEYLIDVLREKEQTLTIAESCTGGLIASQITAIAGSSQVFEAGFVTYSNNMKTKVLGVPSSTLTQYGAVSEQTVIAMAQGALNISQANYAIAVSGIAGPSGGTLEKPVGTVWIAWGDNKEIKTQAFCIPTPRQNFQQTVTARALDLLRRFVLGSDQIPFYIKAPLSKK